MKKIFIALLLMQITSAAAYPQMIQQWASRYNGPSGYDDRVNAMVIDASGNVYVTGNSYDTTVDFEHISVYATVKYNSSGVQQWAAIYSGRPDSSNFANCIGVDAAGNVYVAGTSGGYNYQYNYLDWAVVKYNSSGVQQWVQRWSGPSGFNDVPYAMAVDAMGNLFITGIEQNALLYEVYDFVTIKYNTNGVQQWISTYNYRTTYPSSDIPSAITIDNIGNVYVAGSSYDTTITGTRYFDMVTIKYSPSGALQWVQRHPGYPNVEATANGILTDNLGNVYVSGLYIIKYNTSGLQLWERSSGYNLNSIVLDGSGNVYAAKRGGANITSIKKYNTLGDSLWGRNVGTLYGNSNLAFDNCLGYVYLSATNNNAGNYDYLTIRYDSYGDSLWSDNYNYQGTSYEEVKAITTDGLGNVYVSGSSYGSSAYYDYSTVKYTPSSFFIHTAKRENLNKPINDNQSTSDSIFIDCSLMNYSTGGIRVNIDKLMHTKDSDLEIYLIHPGSGDNGAAIIDTLIYQAGGTGQNFIGTKLDDSAAISINNGTAPFTGSYKPHRPLSQLNGLSMEGNWILKIYDRAAGNVGVLNAWSIDFGMSSATIGIQNISTEVPYSFSLSQNYPNPFNPVTNLEFEIPNSGFVTLRIYNMLGKEVATLVNTQLSPGTYKYNFDASGFSSGVYFYKLQAEGFTETKKMMLIK